MLLQDSMHGMIVKVAILALSAWLALMQGVHAVKKVQGSSCGALNRDINFSDSYVFLRWAPIMATVSNFG
jgi:hypothetical protein